MYEEAFGGWRFFLSLNFSLFISFPGHLGQGHFDMKNIRLEKAMT